MFCAAERCGLGKFGAYNRISKGDRAAHSSFLLDLWRRCATFAGMRRWVFFSGIVLSLTSLMLIQAAGAVHPLPSAVAPDHPVSITASTTGRFGKGYSWNLSVNSAGRAHLVIDPSAHPKAREFTVSATQIQDLLKVVRTERLPADSWSYSLM